MTLAIPQELKEEETSVKLKVIEGGKQPVPKPLGKEPPEDDWLSELEVGTVFLTQDKFGDYILSKWIILHKTDKSVILMYNNTTDPVPVVPRNFCRRHRLWEVLGVRKEE